ncbi:hypothetical protein M3Y99_00434600 [Aphelenchoides fujianensis]|nr:hypothetical protein M3Y99_00434600 [Aphelenchoides fujianensis]
MPPANGEPAVARRTAEDVDREDQQYAGITSLNYTECLLSAKEHLREKSLLFSALNTYECRLMRSLELDREDGGAAGPSAENAGDLYATYSRLGHVHLLALDYARAMSAFQMAYRRSNGRFWQNAANLYGLAICFFHFRIFRPCIHLFNQFVYCYPFNPRATEVHARLGFANKCIGDYQQANRHLNIALNDKNELRIFPRPLLRLHIAHCYDLFGEFPRAKQRYYELLRDAKNLPDDIVAAAYRQLGWIKFQEPFADETKNKAKCFEEAEALISRAVERQPRCGRSICYLGRVVAQRVRLEGASAAFDKFRQVIDIDADANTWFGIGQLYLQQHQPLDALQAFACAVQLDRKHVSAWASLGHLYETHKQFQHALYCFREAAAQAKKPTDLLNQRIRILEKELRVADHLHRQQFNAPLPQTPTTPSGGKGRRDAQQLQLNQPIQLPGPDLCWSLCNIPQQVRQRRQNLRKGHELTYRQGSAYWQMNELAAQFHPPGSVELDNTQRQILHVLKLNEEMLGQKELVLLKQLEERLPRVYDNNNQGGGELKKRPMEDPNTHPIIKTEDAQVPAFLSQNDVAGLLGDFANQPAAEPTAEPTATKPPMDAYEEELRLFEGDHDPFASTPTDENVLLPPPFSLLAQLKVPITITAAELFDRCKKRKEQKLADLKKHQEPATAAEAVEQPKVKEEEDPIEIFDEHCGPPKPPTPPRPSNGQKVDLHPMVPAIAVDNAREANAIELQNFCYKRDIALVRGLTHALRIDLSLFSTKTLIHTAEDHDVEVRTQLKMPGDANLNNLGKKDWAVYSAKSFTSITRYGQYQAESFRHSLKEESEKLRNAPKQPAYQRASGEPAPKRRKAAFAAVNAEAEAVANQIPTKIIKFGTNVDLSNEQIFGAQLRELRKMPAFCRLNSASNLLSYLGYTVLGMNSVQLYMKNNNFASINVNIGPGECEWFGVSYEYYPIIDRMCRERHCDFLKGAWWPDYDDLIKAGVPVYRFTQKAGDLVWVGGGCVHWVQATGWCNNIAWNVGPTNADQVRMAIQAYEWNRLHNYRSLVPMQHLCWQLARSMHFTDQKIFNLVKAVLIRSLAYCQMIVDFVRHTGKAQIRFQSRQKNEAAHYCHTCEIEVFNMLFVKEVGSKFRVFCLQCARRGSLDEYVVLQQISFEELSTTFDQFQLHPTQPRHNLLC